MVYMDGDNNLESAAIYDFLEMSKVGSTDKVRIVVQVDRAVDGEGCCYTNSHGDWKDTRRFLIGNGDTPSDDPLQNLGEQNMGDPGVLEDFITWAVTNYPAEHYLLSIWDHGDGWRLLRKRMAAETGIRISRGEVGVSMARAISSDETDHDVLYMAEVQQALEGARANTSVKLDVVGFDACLMGMVEVAYGIKDYANYMIGSENNEPGGGWPYDTVLADLAATPDMSPQQLAGAIVNHYITSYAGGYGITQAASDVSKAGMLSTKIDNFASVANREWDDLEAARENVTEYHSLACGHSCWGIDLWNFADEVGMRVTSSSIQTAADELKSAIDDFIIAEGSSDVDESRGIAIYFPEDQETFDADPDHTGYEQDNKFMPVDFVQDHKWDEWLQDFYSKHSDQSDLIVEIVSIDNTTIVWGQEPWTWITYRVSNVGRASTPAGQIFLRDWTNGSPTSGYMVVEGPIPPGGSVEAEFAVGHDNIWPVGEYTVKMEVDYRSLVDEVDEDNNFSNSIEFTVVQSRLAYIYGTDLTTADSYQVLLQSNDFLVDLIAQDAVLSTDLGPYDCTLIGPDTGYLSVWGDVGGNQANHIVNSGRPVLGLGEGGYAFFGQLGLHIGWGKGWHGNGRNVYVVDTSSPIWSSPNLIPIPDSRIVPLYSGETRYVAIHYPSPVTDATPIGREPDDPNHYQIIEQDGRFLLWGFSDGPVAMNLTGQQVFVNALKSLLP